jgi:hypothetical protein
VLLFFHLHNQWRFITAFVAALLVVVHFLVRQLACNDCSRLLSHHHVCVQVVNAGHVFPYVTPTDGTVFDPILSSLSGAKFGSGGAA